MAWELVSGIHPTADGYPSGLPLYTLGPLLVSGAPPLFEYGYQAISGNPTLFEWGHIVSSGVADLFEHGYAIASGIPTLFEYGHIVSSGTFNLFEHGHIVISGGHQDDVAGIPGLFLRITGTDGIDEEENVSNLVTDTWATNLRPKISSRKISKVLTVTPTTSGAAVEQTINFFNKNCPFAGRILGIKAVAKNLTVADFDGTSGAVSLVVQTSTEIDMSPAAPTTQSWNTLVALISCKDKATDALCLEAPGDGTNVIDQTYNTIPYGGSLRATLSAQVEDTYSGDGSLVEILVIVEYLPTDVKARHS